jgi:hypothetical protein
VCTSYIVVFQCNCNQRLRRKVLALMRTFFCACDIRAETACILERVYTLDKCKMWILGYLNI